jgi:hypothetical protein
MMPLSGLLENGRRNERNGQRNGLGQRKCHSEIRCIMGLTLWIGQDVPAPSRLDDGPVSEYDGPEIT